MAINIVDRIIVSESGCGMDSARAHGIVDTFDHQALGWQNSSSIRFVNVETGKCVRHPTQTNLGGNNSRNFSRDQLICLSAGLSALNYTEVIEKIIARLKKPSKYMWLAPNTERDYPGTKKYPFPHIMRGGDPVDNGKWRMFDYADPLMPQHILHLYNCAKLTPPDHIYKLGYRLLFNDIMNSGKDLKQEQNQLQCIVKTAGSHWCEMYMNLNKIWKDQTKYYWIDQRNCPEMYNIILNGLDKKNE